MITETELETNPTDILEDGMDTGMEAKNPTDELKGNDPSKEEGRDGKAHPELHEVEGERKKNSGKVSTTKGEHVVSLKGVSKHYGGEENLIRALDNVDLQIRKGAVVSIMGPSGSGKSTLINMIGSLDAPTHGEVVIDGTYLENMSPKELTRYRSDKVGFIFQSFNLLPNLTALENVELPMEFNDNYRADRRQRAEKLLKSIGMTKRSGHFPASLSGGEKQRIAIARSLANNPSIILADEPTGNLDSRTGKQIIELLKTLGKNRSKTLIIVTHDQNIAHMTDEIINISDGKITRIRDVGDEQGVQTIAKTFDLRRHFANLLFDAGYDSVEEVLGLNEAKLAKVKGLKKKDRSHIINRITKTRKKLLGKYHDPSSTRTAPSPPTSQNGFTCPHCQKEIFMEGAVFCPFCAGSIE